MPMGDLGASARQNSGAVAGGRRVAKSEVLYRQKRESAPAHSARLAAPRGRRGASYYRD